MSKKRKIILYSVAALMVLFLCSYIYVSDNLIKDKSNAENSEQSVYNDGEKALKDDLKVMLFTEEKKEKEFTIGKLKEKEGSKVITEEVLSEILKKDGYSLSKKEESIFTYKRNKEASLEKSVYYIGVDNESIALYKTDDKGKLKLEKNYDYPVSILPEVDRNNLKEFTYFHSADKNEIERKLSEFGVKF